MKAFKLTFFVDSTEVTYVTVHPSQLDRFRRLITLLCRYASHFNYNVQFETKEVEL